MELNPVQRALQFESRSGPSKSLEAFPADVLETIKHRKHADSAWLKFLLFWTPVAIAAGIAAVLLGGLYHEGADMVDQPPRLRLFQVPGSSHQPISLP